MIYISYQDLIRFHRFFKPKNGCWNWTGATSKNWAGEKYGTFSIRGKNYKAHRIAVLNSNIEIPKGKHIDHLCRNTLCVNPNHLEVVTPRENTLRGVGPTSKNAKKTHCKHGHKLTAENIVRWVFIKRGWRVCLKCQHRLEKKNRMKRKALLWGISEIEK